MVQEALHYLITTSFPKTGQNHLTIINAEQGLNVLLRFAADFECPSPHEGYHRILYVKPEDTRLNYTCSNIAAILQCVHDSPPIDPLFPHTTARERVGSNLVHRGNSIEVIVASEEDERVKIQLHLPKPRNRIQEETPSAET